MYLSDFVVWPMGKKLQEQVSYDHFNPRLKAKNLNTTHLEEILRGVCQKEGNILFY